MTARERAEAELGAALERCRRFQPRFQPGTPQHTLLKNRTAALSVALELLAGRDGCGREELEAALPPIASLVRKCSSAQRKHPEGTAQYARFQGMLTAMGLAEALIKEALS